MKIRGGLLESWDCHVDDMAMFAERFQGIVGGSLLRSCDGDFLSTYLPYVPTVPI
jgi:hypothetical protein